MVSNYNEVGSNIGLFVLVSHDCVLPIFFHISRAEGSVMVNRHLYMFSWMYWGLRLFKTNLGIKAYKIWKFLA